MPEKLLGCRCRAIRWTGPIEQGQAETNRPYRPCSVTHKGSTMTATKKTTSTAELVAHLPGILGFHPGDSIILTGLTAHGRHALSARFDHDALVPLSPGALDVTVERMREHGARFVLVVTYHRQDTRESLTALTNALEAAGLILHDVSAVEDGQWVSLVTGARAPLPAVLPRGAGRVADPRRRACS